MAFRALTAEQDWYNFSVPVALGCNVEDRWTSSQTSFYSPVYPVQFRIRHNACVRTAHNVSNGLEWAFGSRSFSSPMRFGSSNLTTIAHGGVTVLGEGWPNHVGHQQECVFPMLQLVGARLVNRIVYLDTPHSRFSFTPFVSGLLKAVGTSIQTIEIEPKTMHCFDTVAFCHSPKSPWHSIRQSRLVPQASGQLVVPTLRDATNMRERVHGYCNASRPVRKMQLKTGTILLRNSTRRAMANVEHVMSTLRQYLSQVTVTYIDDLRFCTQAAWFWADVVVSVHGSHLVSQAFMHCGTHLIEVLPNGYEQDFNSAGCACRHRHVLVGLRQANASGENARLRRSTYEGRFAARSASVIVSVNELNTLMSRILTNTVAEGRYECRPERCSYV